MAVSATSDSLAVPLPEPGKALGITAAAELPPTERTLVLRVRVRHRPMHRGAEVAAMVTANPADRLAPATSWLQPTGCREDVTTWASGTAAGTVEVGVRMSFPRPLSAVRTVEFFVRQPNVSSVLKLPAIAALLRPEEAGSSTLPDRLVLEELYENQRGVGIAGPRSFSSHGADAEPGLRAAATVCRRLTGTGRAVPTVLPAVQRCCR